MKHVLLVEDEAPLREALAEQLADRGYAVEQAESGEVALAKLADFAFDVIITDLRLLVSTDPPSSMPHSTVTRHRRHCRHRLRNCERRRRSDQTWRVGFCQQAVPDR